MNTLSLPHREPQSFKDVMKQQIAEDNLVTSSGGKGQHGNQIVTMKNNLIYFYQATLMLSDYMGQQFIHTEDSAGSWEIRWD